jgi:hypothetical protein
MAGRKFCSLPCAENWRRQNDALIEAAAPFHVPAQKDSLRSPHAVHSDSRRGK